VEIKNRKRLMKVKDKMKRKRPSFVQFEAWRLKRLKDNWKRPRGIDNHMRQNRKGWPKSVNVGWRTPKAVRHLHPSGKEEIMVNNPGDLTLIDPEYQVGRISGQIGGRKRVQILEEAKRLNVKLLNPVFELPSERIFEEEEEE
jgi:large subunit ribosomal protein L32e